MQTAKPLPTAKPTAQKAYPVVRMHGRDCVRTSAMLIGSAYEAPPPAARPLPTRDERLLQRALLDERTAHQPHPIGRVLGAIWGWL